MRTRRLPRDDEDIVYGNSRTMESRLSSSLASIARSFDSQGRLAEAKGKTDVRGKMVDAGVRLGNAALSKGSSTPPLIPYNVNPGAHRKEQTRDFSPDYPQVTSFRKRNREFEPLPPMRKIPKPK